MSSLLLELANIVLVAIEFFILMVLAGGFFSTTISRLQYFIRCVISYMVNYLVLIAFGNQTILRLILLSLLFTVELKTVYRARVTRTLLVAVLTLSLLNVMDSVICYILALASGLEIAELLISPYSYYLLAYVVKIVELLLVTIVRVWAKKRFHNRVTSGSYVRFCVFPLMALTVTIILWNAFISYPDAGPQILPCVAILLASDVCAIILLDQFEQQQQNLIEQKILHRELETAKDNVSMLSASYQRERKLTHDFQNQLMTVLGLLEKDGGENEAQAYIREVLKSEHMHPAKKITTNRTIFDIIVGQKYMLAAQKNIVMTLQLDDMSAFPLPDNALVIVLANLLDNAIEACEQVGNVSQRQITVKAKVDESESLLFIENSVVQPIEIQDGRIKTTKKEAKEHGYGLQNVQAIIQQYNGAYVMHYSDFKFSFVVHFLH